VGNLSFSGKGSREATVDIYFPGSGGAPCVREGCGLPCHLNACHVTRWRSMRSGVIQSIARQAMGLNCLPCDQMALHAIRRHSINREASHAMVSLKNLYS
jgi:hypothetical protein